MAKRNVEQDPTPQKAKVRVFFAEVEGSNDSVREALKTMVAAMHRPAPLVSARNPVNGESANGEQALTPPSEAADFEEEVQEAVEESQEMTDEAGAANRKPRGQGPKKDRNAGIELVPNLNFVPAGKPALKAFFGEKAPSNDIENVLVATYYMQNTMELSTISPGHVRTALKHVGVPTPVDLKQTIRNMKKDKNWLDFSTLDEIRVATEGENQVEHEMGKQPE